MAFVYYVLLAVGVPLIQSESVKADTCPSLYMRFNKSPTFCLAPKSSCSKASSGVSKDQKTEIVNTHNSLRNRLALGQETTNSFPGAADMLQMVWDEELAGIAQKHSDQCVYRHDCRTCRQVGNFSVGQNLYTLYTSQNTCPPPNWTTAINSWYSEVKDMPVSYISPFKVNTPSDKKIGHFTQIAWASTWRLGCGFTCFAVNKGPFKWQQLYTCNYGPAGNILNGQMYEKGISCSNCPPNTSCGSDYAGLCYSTDGKGPSMEIPDQALMFCDFLEGNTDCDAVVTGKSWKKVSLFYGAYKEAVLNGGTSTTLVFNKKVTSSNNMCVQFEYRKGPYRAGDVSNNNMKLNIQVPAYSYVYKAQIGLDSSSWIKHTIYLQWRFETQVGVEFSVPTGAPDQYVNLRYVAVKGGPC
ncbi:venom allergen 5-like isoform X2 [Tachypleus tridentatus]|uniref:venom allergen 5-like isoform X2 n=2 Tax=Tachypleus tridentatus TaxID=6853 RepID=UPI003FD5EEA0